MNRFGKRPRRGRWLKSVLLPVVFFGALMGMFLAGLGSLDRATQAQQLRSTEETIRRAAVHCYAVEGQYPPSLQYLEEHYGIRIDRERYVVHYQTFAANLMPDVAVFPLDRRME